MTSERNAQIETINGLIKDLKGFYRFAMQGTIKELPSVLRRDELPERIVVVERGWNNDPTLMVVTAGRIIFLAETAGLSLKPKIRVDEYPCDKITAVEYKPGPRKHVINFRANGKKESFRLRWWDGKFQARQIAEYVHAKMGPTASSTNVPVPETSRSPFAKDDATAKAYAIEDAVHRLDDLSGSERTLAVRGELKRLPDILIAGEFPERLMPAAYDDRRGLKISAASKRQGLLVATDRRLVFIDKDMRAVKVEEFQYEKISYMEVSTGTMSGKITVHVSGDEEVFEGDRYRVRRLGGHLQEKIAPHATVPTKTKAEVVNEALFSLGYNQEKLDTLGLGQLPELLEDDELPEKVTFATYEDFHGTLVGTASRLLFVPNEDMKPIPGISSPGVLSFPYEDIESVEQATGVFFGKIIITLSDGNEIFDSATNGNVRAFAEYIQAKIAAPPAPNPPPTPASRGAVSVADELEKLHGLVVKGILTQEEFEAEKRKLLSG